MFRLASPEPVWLDLPGLSGVRAKFAPVSHRALRTARAKAREAMTDDAEDAVGEGGAAFSAELLRAGLRDWEGVLNPEGDPLPFTPDAVEAFLGDVRAFEAADAAYVIPWLQRDAEKNGSSPSPAGTSAGAMPEDGTANSAATPALASGAVSAPTASRPPRRKRANTPSS